MKHYLSYVEDVIKSGWDNPAITNYGGNTFRNCDIARNIARLHIFFKQCGIREGENIAICARNSAEWCVAFLAITTYKAVAVPLLADFLPENIVNLVKISDSRMLFTDKNVLSGLQRSGAVAGFAEYDNFIGAFDIVTYENVINYNANIKVNIEDADKAFEQQYPKGMTAADINFNIGALDDLAVISYTSGTSSSPKGVMLAAKSLSGNVEIARKLVPIAFKEPGNTLSILPLAHIFGLAFDFLFLFTSGCHIYIFTEKPVPVRLLKALSEVKPFIFLTVPMLIEKIFRAKVIPTLKKPAMKFLTSIPGVRQLIYKKVRAKIIDTFGGNLRSIVLGGAAISLPVEKVMRKIRLPYTVGYGMTECAPLIGYSPWESFRLGSCGRAVDNVVVGSLLIKPSLIEQGESVTITGFSGNKATVYVYDMVGRCVEQLTMTGNSIELNTFTTSGVYTVRVMDANGEQHVGRVMVK